MTERTDAPLNQDALDDASFALQRHFGREGSIYGIKACEEIARIAIVAYERVALSERVPTEGVDDIMLQREFDGFAAVVLFKGHSDESKAKAQRLVDALKNAAPQVPVSQMIHDAGGDMEKVHARMAATPNRRAMAETMREGVLCEPDICRVRNAAACFCIEVAEALEQTDERKGET